MMNFTLLSSRRCNELLLERITQLECNNLNSALYNRKETIEINPRSSDIANNVPDQSVPSAITYRKNQKTCKLVTTWERRTELQSNLNVESKTIMFFQIAKQYKIKVSILLKKNFRKLSINENMCMKIISWPTNVVS